ncbi:hypothetical protein BDW22DRAFT_1362385 [Trametopsis cervina]|nr:hypothetical protein BDW22DRAFT_1362385 [Trametopsis cervina]
MQNSYQQMIPMNTGLGMTPPAPPLPANGGPVSVPAQIYHQQPPPLPPVTQASRTRSQIGFTRDRNLAHDADVNDVRQFVATATTSSSTSVRSLGIGVELRSAAGNGGMDVGDL